MRYFDSGVLLKLYLREPNSPQAVSLVQGKNAAPLLTALHRLEMKAAIGQKYGRGEITATERDAVLIDFENDVASVCLWKSPRVGRPFSPERRRSPRLMRR